MTNDEGQMTKEAQIPDSEKPRDYRSGCSLVSEFETFELWVSFVNRHSLFVIYS
jgi:hypothetical protein